MSTDRVTNSSKSYEDRGETDIFIDPSGIFKLSDVKTENEVILNLDDERYRIVSKKPKCLKDIYDSFRGRFSLLEIYKEDEVISKPVPPSTRDWLKDDVCHRQPREVTEQVGGKQPVLALTNKELLRKDIALQSLKAIRTTDNKEFWKILQKAHKAPQEITYKVPQGIKVSNDQKKEINKLIDFLVRGEFGDSSDLKLIQDFNRHVFSSLKGEKISKTKEK